MEGNNLACGRVRPTDEVGAPALLQGSNLLNEKLKWPLDLQRTNYFAIPLRPREISRVKVFYTGPLVNAEMLVVMLEKHGIVAKQEFVEPLQPDDGDLNRLTNVFVEDSSYDKAYQLFYAEREDEL